MPTPDRLPLAFLALLAASPIEASAVQRRPSPRHLTVRGPPRAASLDLAVAPGVAFRTPFAYIAGISGGLVRVPHDIGPDGTYDDYADFVRSIDGTPCGEVCTRRSL